MKLKKIIITSFLIFNLIYSQILWAAGDGKSTTLSGSGGGSGIGDYLMTMLTSTGMSWINSSIIRCRGVTPDSVLAAVGAVTHLGGEIYTTIKQSNVSSMTVDQSDDASKAAEKQIKSTKEVLENLELKYDLQVGAATAYGLASGTALLGWYSLDDAKDQCKKAADGSKSNCAADKKICEDAASTCEKAWVPCEEVAKPTCQIALANTSDPNNGRCIKLQTECNSLKPKCESEKSNCEAKFKTGKGAKKDAVVKDVFTESKADSSPANKADRGAFFEGSSGVPAEKSKTVVQSVSNALSATTFTVPTIEDCARYSGDTRTKCLAYFATKEDSGSKANDWPSGQRNQNRSSQSASSGNNTQTVGSNAARDRDLQDQNNEKIREAQRSKNFGNSSTTTKEPPFDCIENCKKIAAQLNKCNEQLEKTTGEQLMMIKAKEDNKEYSDKNAMMLDVILLQTDYGMAFGCGNTNIQQNTKDRANGNSGGAGVVTGLAGIFGSIQGYVHDTGASLVDIAKGTNGKQREEDYRKWRNTVYTDKEMQAVQNSFSKYPRINEFISGKSAKGESVSLKDLMSLVNTDAEKAEIAQQYGALQAQGIDLQKAPKSKISQKDVQNAEKYEFSCADNARSVCTDYGNILTKSLNRCSEVLAPEEAAKAKENRGWMDMINPFSSHERPTEDSEYFASIKKINNTLDTYFHFDSPYNMEVEKQTELNKKYNQFFLSYNDNKDYTPTGYIHYYEKMLLLNGFKQSLTTKQYNQFMESFKMVNEEATIPVNSILKVAMDKGINLFLPKAQAMEGENMLMLALNIGPQLIGIWKAVTAENMSQMDHYMATYNKRALVFGAAAALLGMTAYMTKKKIDEVKKNLKELEDMKKDMDDAAAAGGGGGAMGGGAPETAAAQSAPTTKDIGNTNQAASTQDKIKIPKSDKVLSDNLPCVTPNCKPVEQELNQKLSDKMLNGLSASDASKYNKGVQAATAIGNDLQGKNKIKGATMNKIASLGKQKKAIDDLNANLKRKINDQLVSMGRDPVDFEGLQKKIIDNMQGAVAGGFAGAENMGSPAQSMGDQNGNKDDKAQKVDDSVFATTKAANNQGGGKFGSTSDGGIITPLDPEQLSDPTSPLPSMPSNSDIISDPGREIWTVISSRYMKTGVTRLLDEKEIDKASSD